MNTHVKKFGTAVATLALTLAATLSLSGCFGFPTSQLADDGAKPSVETPADGIPRDTGAGDADDADYKGTFPDDADTAIPSDFPTVVPLTDGKVRQVVSSTKEGLKEWTVYADAPGIPEAFNSVSAQMNDAGFETLYSELTDSKGTALFEGHGYEVFLFVALDITTVVTGITVAELG